MVNPVLSIDVSKSISHAALFLSQGQVYLKPFSFPHSPAGVDSLLVHLEKVEQDTGVRPKVALESTGNFSKPLVRFFEDHGYNVVVFNPLETHQLKKNSIRKVKTDIVDTHRIAQVFYSNTYTFHTKTDSHILELRALCRQYEGFNNLYTETQLRFRSVLDLLFPNYDKIFNTVCCKTSLHLLSIFPSPERVLSADRRELTEVLRIAKHSSAWVERKVDEILLAARESLPDTSAQQSNTRVLKDYIEILITQQKILTDMRAQMISWARLSPHFELLLSIPGVGELTATTILAEIGDIYRFPTAKHLTAFAGLDSSVYESGKFKSTNNRITKRGSSYLRKALYQATVAAVSNQIHGPRNKVLHSFYAKKLSEGKPFKVAIIASCNKLLRIIYGMLTKNEPFKTAV